MSELEPTLMSADEARERFARVDAAVSTARDDLTALYAGRAWLSLGYGSWDEACDAMLGVRVALPREERREAVAEMRGAGMPVRAIGAALGVGVGTVHRDLAGVPSGTPAVLGRDGKQYAPTQPPRDVTEPEPFMPGVGDHAAEVSASPDPGGWPAVQPDPTSTGASYPAGGGSPPPSRFEDPAERERRAEAERVEQANTHVARSVTALLRFTEPASRAQFLRDWDPRACLVNPDNVTPDALAELADALGDLAKEWANA